MDLSENTTQIRRFHKIKKLPKTILASKLYSFVVLAVVILILAGFVVLINKNQASTPKTNASLAGKVDDQTKTNEDILKKVEKLTVVPENETPEIATIADTTKLGSQAFFSRAQNGDVVIVYRTAKRVVLYRPTENKIIETGPLTEPSPTPFAGQ